MPDRGETGADRAPPARTAAVLQSSLPATARMATHLRTTRLQLRPLHGWDFGFFWALARHPDVRRHLGGPVDRLRRLSRFRQLLSAVGRGGVWIVTLLTTGRQIGLIEMSPHRDGQDVEVSYQFHPRFWGQGFASEAVGAVLRHAITDAGLDRVIAETQGANRASLRLLQRLGLVELERVHRFGAEQVILATRGTPRQDRVHSG